LIRDIGVAKGCDEGAGDGSPRLIICPLVFMGVSAWF
jgi:hypothetical protein